MPVTANLSVHDVVRDRLVRCVFQPVVTFATGEIFAYEALARPTAERYREDPQLLFEEAAKVGMVGELGRMMRGMAIEGCPNHPLLINVAPHEFDEGWLVQPNDPIFQHNHAVFLEITESVPLAYFAQCHNVLAEIRGKGLGLAVDDLGAGYSNLKYISDLHPEIVKLDRQLIAGIRAESRQFKLASGIVRLCVDMGAKVVIEGIETRDELAAAAATGAHYGQGFLIARPSFPPPTPQWPPK
ncbi:MAG: EAL domain-containing protein [Myxococcota bacterium]